MKEKFYVPFNTAQRLKANGYNDESDRFYDNSGMLTPKPIVNNSKHLDHDMKMYSAPTYHEVIDWLESKDILIDCTCGFDYHTEEEWYRCFVIERKKRFDDAFISMIAPTREEALNAAILKALELI